MAINREKVIRSAEKYVSKGKLEHAINEYRKVLKENPNDANTLNRVGDLYARIEKIDEAVKLFTQIAEQYTSDGFFVKAIAIYKKIIKLDPTVLQVYERLAELYHKQGLLNEARTQYQVLADYYQKHDNATSAINIYQRMVEMEPDNPSYHLKLAELYQSQQLNDKSVAAYRQLADLLMVNGSVEEASQVYLRALDVGHRDLGFVREAVSGLYDGGHAAAAAKVLARATELNPEAASIEGEIGLGESAPALDETAIETEAEVLDSAEPGPPEDETGEGGDEAEVGEAEVDSDDDVFEIDVSAEAEEDDVFEIEVDEEPTFDLEAPEESAEEEGPVDVAEATAGLHSSTEDPDESVVFEIDLDEDDSESQVQPPEDMDSTGTGTAFRRSEEGADVEVDWSSPAKDEIEVETPVELEVETPDEFELEIEVEGGFEKEPELELEAPELEEVPPSEPQVEEAAALGEETEEGLHRPEDLLDEARVFAKYGLKDKARNRVGQLLEDRPDHPGGLLLRAEMALEENDHDLVFDLGRRLVEHGADTEEWEALRPRLEDAGYTLTADRLLGRPGEVVDGLEVEEPAAKMDLEAIELEPLEDFDLDEEPESVEIGADDAGPVPAAVEPAAAEAPEPESAPEVEPPPEPARPKKSLEDTESRKRKDRISRLLEDLDLDALGVSKPKKRKTDVPPPAISVPPEPEAADEPVAEETEPSVAAPPPFEEPAPPEPRKKVSLIDELALDELDDELGGVFDEAKARAAGSTESITTGEAPPATPAQDLDETGMSWLDEPSTEDQPAAAVDDALFDEEDDFFDLASELERELSEDELTDEPEIVQSQEQSLEEIIDGFKKGVAENLSPEDFDTHFNLGIAYREMGLIDEAIGEFQLSSKDDRYLVDSSSMLGMCFLEKGLPELALRWYRKGLEAPDIEEAKTLGLLYEMGSTYLTMGDEQAAYKTFTEIHGIDDDFRDVQQKLQDLEPAVG